jgi:hypothetical protein
MALNWLVTARFYRFSLKCQYQSNPFFQRAVLIAEERAAIEEKYAVDLAIQKKHITDLKVGVPSARIVEMPGANLYIFLSDEADVLRGDAGFFGSFEVSPKRARRGANGFARGR